LPDIWTKYPEIVRDLLQEGGFKCGAEPRVLKGRDPSWTCIIDGKTISGDLYIHHVNGILKLPPEVREPRRSSLLGSWEFLALGVLLAVIACQAWMIRRLKPPASRISDNVAK